MGSDESGATMPQIAAVRLSERLQIDDLQLQDCGLLYNLGSDN